MYMFIYSKCFAGSSHKKCVYPTIRIYLLKKCIHYYTYKNALHCQFSRCRQQCAHTCICILFQKSAHPTIHTNLPAAVRKRRKNAVLQAGQQLQTNCGVHGQRPCTASALPLHPHRAHNLPAIHPAAAPRSRLPATLPRCRAHKNKKRRKNTGNTRCVKKKNMKKEIKMDKYRKKNQKNKRK